MGCCCFGSKKKEKKEYTCVVNPDKCPTKTVDADAPVPQCCGKSMKEKK